MTDSRISLLFPDERFRLRFSRLLFATLGSCGLMLSGCLAQQADLKELKRDLVNEMHQERKALQIEVARAKEAIAEVEKQTEKLKAENKKLFRSRAEINQQFREFREKDLAEVNGEIEKINRRVEDVHLDLESEKNQINTHIQEVETQVQTQRDDLTKYQADTTALIEQVDQDAAAYTQKMTEFQVALATFKDSLADLGDKFVQEAERDSRVETELNQQLSQNTQQSKVSMDEIQTHLSTNSANIDEVSRSVGTIRAAVEQSGTLFGGRLDEQADRVTLLETSQTQLEGDMLTLTDKVNTDTQALKAYLEQDVQSSMNTMVVSLQEQQLPLNQRVDALQGDLQGVESELVAHSNQLQELTQTAVQLREHQDVMGSLLGKRGDDLIQHAGRLDERLNLLESHQTSLDQTLETNRQNTTRHLDELMASVTSMNQVLQKTTGELATQITSQEQNLNDLTQEIQGLQSVKGELDTNQRQVESIAQSNAEFQKSVQQVTNRLLDLEKHQSTITAKIDADVQTINTHLTKVNSAIISEKNALSEMNTQVNSRIDEQERHLNNALTSFQAVQGVEETSQSNRAHLNQLTDTVNKLREVLTTIGTKFGERVDQHEARLVELAKRVNRLQAKKPKK